MPGPLGRLLAVIGIDSREFDTGLGRAQKSLTGFGRGADLAMGLAAGAVAGGLISTLGAARDWETAFTGVKKVLDTTGMSVEQETTTFAKLETGLRDLAKTIPITTTELAGLAEAGGAMGIATDDLVEFARVTAIIGTTTDVAAQDAATAMGKIAVVMGIASDEFDNFGAGLVALGNKGQSFESDILAVANRISGTSKLIGMSMDEMLGWSAAMANVGIEAEAAGGSFQMFVKEIQKAAILGTKNLDVVAKTAGMTNEAFQELWGQSSSQALTAFLSGLSELSEKDQMLTKGLLGLKGTRVSDMISKLTANVDNLTGSLDLSATGVAENTAMMVEAEQRFATLDSGMQLFWNRVNDVAITLGRTFMPSLRAAVEHGGNLVTMLGDLLKAFPSVTNVVTPLVTALTGLMALKFGARFLGAMIPGGGMFAEALASSIGPPLGGVAKKLGLAFGTTFGLAAAGTALAILVPMVIEMFDKINALSAKGAGIDEAIMAGAFAEKELNAELALTEKLIAENRKQFTLFPDTIFGSGLAVLPDITGLTTLEKHRDTLKARLALIKGDVVDAAADPQARQAWRDLLLGPQMQLGADTARANVEKMLAGTVKAVGGIVTGLGSTADGVDAAFTDIATSIRQGFGNVKQALKGGDQQMIDPATRMSNMRNRLAQVAQKINQAIKVGDPWAISYWTDAYAKQQSLLTGLEGAVGQTKGQVTATLRSMGINVDRIWGKVKRDTNNKSDAAADSAISAAERTARRVARALKGIAPKAEGWGEDAIASFALGMAKATGAVGQATGRAAQAVFNRLHTSSPAKEGPLSKDGGPGAWGEQVAAMRPRALAAVNVPVGVGAGGDGGIHVHFHAPVFANDASYRQIANHIERATRQTRRERRHTRLAEG